MIEVKLIVYATPALKRFHPCYVDQRQRGALQNLNLPAPRLTFPGSRQPGMRGGIAGCATFLVTGYCNRLIHFVFQHQAETDIVGPALEWIWGLSLWR